MSQDVQEQVDMILLDLEEELTKKVEAIKHSFAQIRTGQPSKLLVESVMVEYYGSKTPLSQIANITTEGQSLKIKPYDKSALSSIVKGIFESDLGITPNNTGEQIILEFPPLTTERRTELVKLVKKTTNEYKQEVNKSTRHKAIDSIRDIKSLREDEKKSLEKEVDVIKNKYFKMFEEEAQKKEQGIKL